MTERFKIKIDIRNSDGDGDTSAMTDATADRKSGFAKTVQRGRRFPWMEVAIVAVAVLGALIAIALTPSVDTEVAESGAQPAAAGPGIAQTPETGSATSRAEETATVSLQTASSPPQPDDDTGAATFAAATAPDEMPPMEPEADARTEAPSQMEPTVTNVLAESVGVPAEAVAQDDAPVAPPQPAGDGVEASAGSASDAAGDAFMDVRSEPDQAAPVAVDRPDTTAPVTVLAAVVPDPKPTRPTADLAEEDAAIANEEPAQDLAALPEPARRPSVAALDHVATNVGGSVARAYLTTGIRGREPVDTITESFNFPSEDGREFFYFTELLDLAGKAVVHRWERDGHFEGDVTFPVGSNRWRVYSTKMIAPRQDGVWTVSVRTKDGTTLADTEFVVRRP